MIDYERILQQLQGEWESYKESDLDEIELAEYRYAMLEAIGGIKSCIKCKQAFRVDCKAASTIHK